VPGAAARNLDRQVCHRRSLGLGEGPNAGGRALEQVALLPREPAKLLQQRRGVPCDGITRTPIAETLCMLEQGRLASRTHVVDNARCLSQRLAIGETHARESQVVGRNSAQLDHVSASAIDLRATVRIAARDRQAMAPARDLNSSTWPAASRQS
jgi:hypothetical protein